ncbi:peptidoglycan D,D-transpeptidase FtsI family protein [Curvivirga aplysinae]|uniref:peptidoglycan D,D-transpeptidase FtsI family protein n=1 Tax=Curvivirga aplysinae TaxID=2529852 RepID=UPI001C3FEC58|nr:penicillin-binding protein 2 [Curvivirga aplysinae]
MILSHWKKLGYTTKPVKRMTLSDLKRQATLQGQQTEALETGRTRLMITGALMALAFTGIGFRMIDVMALSNVSEPKTRNISQSQNLTFDRAPIVDRTGMLVATTVKTVSLAADPRKIMDPQDSAEKLGQILTDIPVAKLYKMLSRKAKFVWVDRRITPTQQQKINALGIPGLEFRTQESRVYPQGNLMAHVLGYTNVDNKGISGLEKSFEETLTSQGEALRLSIDGRVQHIVRDEVQKAMTEFQAIGGSAIVLDANNGQVVSMVSLPDFDPNQPGKASVESHFNRTTLGVYELGSTFKIFNSAMALESGTANMSSSYDASKPIRIARFTINDYHGKNRVLSLPEVFIYSSNIGSAKMAEAFGAGYQKDFLQKIGMLSPSPVELPEVGRPQYPKTWRPINMVTISYGHGIAVSPMHVAAGVASMVNGGTHYQPSLIMQDTKPKGTRVISARSSKAIRKLMRANNIAGSGKKSNAIGYFVGGKTGTADKVKATGGYADRARISSYVAAFPMHKPKYVVYVMLDEPKGNKKTFGYATGGWVAAPIIKQIVTRAAPILGVTPIDPTSEEVNRELALKLPQDSHT